MKSGDEMTESGGRDPGATRQKTIDALCEHFANDALSVEEFERRVDLAHKAGSNEELEGLLADLTPAGLPSPREPGGSLILDSFPASVPDSRVKEKGFMVAALGGVERKGRWIPARQNYAFALMGGLALDFREALLPPGETEVWIFTALGGAEVIVPPGLAVDTDGVAILGSFGHADDATPIHDPNAPLLRIRGISLLGGVEVKVRHAGETEKDAKRRRRFERKEQQKRLRGRH
jgi:hypothetical protein